MAGFVVVRRLEVSVDIAVAGRKNPAMLGRVKPDNRRLDARQLEYDLDFLMRLHVMGRIADPVEDVVRDQILTAGHQKRQRLFRIEAGSFGCSRDKTFEVFEGTDLLLDRHLVESPGGLSPPGAPRSVREPLDSYGSRCSAVSMAEPPVGKERWIGSAQPVKPVSRPLGFATQPLELAARPADDIEIDPLQGRTQLRLVEWL